MVEKKRTKTPLLLIGGGGHCRSCIDVIESTEIYDIVGIVVEDNAMPNNLTPYSMAYNMPYSIAGSDADLPQLLQQTPHCFIALGQIKTSDLRKKIFADLKSMGAVLPTIISPFSQVSETAKIGEGTIVMHQAMVNAYSQIGDNCIINSKALIEHDCVVANNTHISTGAILNGEVSIGENCLVGSATIIKQGIELADEVTVGAGSLVLSSITNAGTYKGIIK